MADSPSKAQAQLRSSSTIVSPSKSPSLGPSKRTKKTGSETIEVKICPGCETKPFLGAFVHLSIKTEPVFQQGLRQDYIDANSNEQPTKGSVIDYKSNLQAKDKALSLVGSLAVSFNMAQVVEVSGSASLDFGTHEKSSMESRTFSKREWFKRVTLDMSRITRKDLAGYKVAHHTHVVTCVDFGKNVSGNIEVELNEEGKKLHLQGGLNVKLANVPISTSGNAAFDYKTMDKYHDVTAKLKCIGSTAGGVMTTTEEFLFHLRKHDEAERDNNAAIVSYVLTPFESIDAFDEIQAVERNEGIANHLTEQAITRMFEMKCLLMGLDQDRRGMPYGFLTGSEKEEYGHANQLASESVNKLLASADDNMTEPEIGEFLKKTKCMTPTDYLLAAHDTPLFKFYRIRQEALKKWAKHKAAERKKAEDAKAAEKAATFGTVRYGSKIQLVQKNTAGRLHSPGIDYGEGSEGQEVSTLILMGRIDLNDVWVVSAAHPHKARSKDGEPVAHKDVFRLQHKETSKFLHAGDCKVDRKRTLGGSQKFKVSAVTIDNTDTQSDWQVVDESADKWELGRLIRLKNLGSGRYLHSTKKSTRSAKNKPIEVSTLDDKDNEGNRFFAMPSSG